MTNKQTNIKETWQAVERREEKRNGYNRTDSSDKQAQKDEAKAEAMKTTAWKFLQTQIFKKKTSAAFSGK